MTSAAKKIRYTPDEYLAFERAAEIRHQLVDGQIFAMSGTSSPHNIIAGNIYMALRTQTRGRPCRVYMSDVRFAVRRTGMFTYPDVAAFCGKADYWDASVDTILNPSVVVEVLSPSTAAYDRGEKFAHYQQIPSLKHYVLVAQDRAFVQVFSLETDVWVYAALARMDDVLQLPAIGCEIPLSVVYELVEFDETENAADNPDEPG
jgi:Uma2 family endonuclease